MSFETYIQRADDYIAKQIHKFQQQKRGNRSPPRANGYHHMSAYQQQDRPPSHSGCPSSPTPKGGLPGASSDWTQEYDARSQRWYYIEKVHTNNSTRDTNKFSGGASDPILSLNGQDQVYVAKINSSTPDKTVEVGPVVQARS